MARDKYSALWVSHSSLRDFVSCPRAYYLNNVYKDPKTGHKISLMSPSLSLGQAVHEVLELLSVLPLKQRFSEPLIERFENSWEKVSGKRGGFFDESTERRYKDRGANMIRRVIHNKGPVSQKAIKVKAELPYFWLSEEENIILCGKIDWLEYLPETDSVHIVDFKTGRKKEDKRSLQLPIYLLLVNNCQSRDVTRASYWYLETDDDPSEQKLPKLDDAHKSVLQLAKKLKVARQFDRFSCPSGEKGCFACRGLERIVAGEGELVGLSGYNQDIYVLEEGSDGRIGEEIL